MGVLQSRQAMAQHRPESRGQTIASVSGASRPPMAKPKLPKLSMAAAHAQPNVSHDGMSTASRFDVHVHVCLSHQRIQHLKDNVCVNQEHVLRCIASGLHCLPF